MNKKQLREMYRQKRAALSEAEKEILLQRIVGHFQQLHVESFRYLHHYIAADALHELSPLPIIRFLDSKFPSLIKVIPRMKGNDLEAILFNPNLPMIKNRWGVEEPAEGVIIPAEWIEVALVPLLSFDEKGNRVGYGKGCYDRFLSRCKRDTIKIGLSFFESVKEISDTDHFDIPLNYCITPERIYEFG